MRSIRLVGFVGTFAVITACSRREPEQAQVSAAAQVQASAAPSFQAPIDSLPRDSIIAYGRRLTFDTSHAGSDAQHLVARRGGRLVVGPFARIAPEDRLHRLRRADLAAGRIVARIDSDGAYPERGIAAGVNYLWVDSTASGWRSVVVPEDPGQPMAVKTLRFAAHGRALPAAEEPAQARWTWSPDGGAMAECYVCPPPDFWCIVQSSEAVRLIR